MMSQRSVTSRLVVRFVGAILLFFIHISPATGQTNTGEIGGIVKDNSGAVLPGATVTAKHPASGTVVVRITDGEGRFFLPALRIGLWEITALLSGFAAHPRRVAVEIGATVG